MNIHQMEKIGFKGEKRTKLKEIESILLKIIIMLEPKRVIITHGHYRHAFTRCNKFASIATVLR